MEVAGVFVIIILCLIGFLVLVAIVRYGVDSSKTSRKLERLVNEVITLKTELNKLKSTTNIIDKKI